MSRHTAWCLIKNTGMIPIVINSRAKCFYTVAAVSITQRRQRKRDYISIQEHELDFQIHCSSINLDDLSGCTCAIRLEKTGKGK